MQEESRVIKEQIGAKEDAEEAAAKARDSLLGSMGNLVHDSVPVHDDEVRRQPTSLHSHVEPRTRTSSCKQGCPCYCIESTSRPSCLDHTYSAAGT